MNAVDIRPRRSGVWMFDPKTKSGRDRRRWTTAHAVRYDRGYLETLCGKATTAGRVIEPAPDDIPRCGRCSRALSAPTVCAVAGCGAGGRLVGGLCSAHYSRVHRTGDIGSPVRELHMPEAPCREKDCATPVRGGGQGFCPKHYSSKIRSGELTTRRANDVAFHELSTAWVGDDASYGLVHARLRSWRGRPDALTCTHCGGSAQEWAYDLVDPNERVSPDGVRYSVNPWHYLALCKSCHRQFDFVNRRAAS